MDIFKFTLRLLTVTVALGIAATAESQQMDHESSEGPSAEEIQAMDQQLRNLIGSLPERYLQQANNVQDLHMKFVGSMREGRPDLQFAARFFNSAIGFLKILKADVALKQLDSPGYASVRKLMMFLASDFGKSTLPDDIPTEELIDGEIRHLIAERENI